MERTPIASTSFGAAWLIDLEPDEVARGSTSHGIIHAPWAHPLWSWYVVWSVHLRPIEGFPPASLARPEATHEFQVWAAQDLDPNADRSADIVRKLLSPQNLVVQLELPDDAAALEITRRLLTAVARAELSPDTDHRRRQLHWLTEQQRSFGRPTELLVDVRELDFIRRFG